VSGGFLAWARLDPAPQGGIFITLEDMPLWAHYEHSVIDIATLLLLGCAALANLPEPL
jgi:hypothetical protein